MRDIIDLSMNEGEPPSRQCLAVLDRIGPGIRQCSGHDRRGRRDRPRVPGVPGAPPGDGVPDAHLRDDSGVCAHGPGESGPDRVQLGDAAARRDPLTGERADRCGRRADARQSDGPGLHDRGAVAAGRCAAVRGCAAGRLGVRGVRGPGPHRGAPAAPQRGDDPYDVEVVGAGGAEGRIRGGRQGADRRAARLWRTVRAHRALDRDRAGPAAERGRGNARLCRVRALAAGAAGRGNPGSRRGAAALADQLRLLVVPRRALDPERNGRAGCARAVLSAPAGIRAHHGAAQRRRVPPR